MATGSHITFFCRKNSRKQSKYTKLDGEQALNIAHCRRVTFNSDKKYHVPLSVSNSNSEANKMPIASSVFSKYHNEYHLLFCISCK